MPTNPPLWQDTLTVNGSQIRRADALLVMTNGSTLGARSGIIPGSGALTCTVSGTTISVTNGGAHVYQSGQGLYRVVMPSAWSGTLNAADPTYTRIDLVYLRVWDTDYDASGLRQGDVVYLPGTPSATPSAPTPSGTLIYMPLATITVPPSGGGSASVSTAVRPYTVAPGGILPASSTADLAAGGWYVGQARFNTVRGQPEYWNGTSWAALGDYSAYTPAWTSAASPQPALGNGTLSGRWTQVGKTVTALISFLAGSTTTFGNGEWAFSLPVASANIGSTQKYWTGTALGINPGTAYWPGTSQIESGASVVRAVSSTTAAGSANARWAPTVPQTWASTHQLNLSITYEAAT